MHCQWDIKCASTGFKINLKYLAKLEICISYKPEISLLKSIL